MKNLNGYAMVPGWLVQKRPPSTALHVYVVLAMYATFRTGTGEYSGARPKRETIAEMIGCSSSTVDRALSWLVKQGAAVRIPQYAPDGSQKPSKYRLAFGSLYGPAGQQDSGDEGGVVTSDEGGVVTSDEGGLSPVTHNPEPIDPEPFEPEETIATALVSAGSVEPKREDITKGWIDYCRANNVTLTPTQIKRYAAKIKELRDGGISDELTKRALAEMLKDCVVHRVTLLDNYVSRAQQGPERSPRRLTRTEESMVDNISPDALALLAGSLTNQQQAIGAS